MSRVTGQIALRGSAFAEIVRQSSKTNLEIITQPLGLFDHHHDVQSRIDLRVPAFRLGNAKQGINLGEQYSKATTLTQYLKIDTCVIASQRQLGFLPDAVRDQCVDLASSNHAAHEFQRFICDREAEFVETRGEASNTQNADGIFDEGAGHMPERPAFDICEAAVRVDDVSFTVLGDRVDR